MNTTETSTTAETQRLLDELCKISRDRRAAERARARAMDRTAETMARLRELGIGGTQLANLSGLSRTTVDDLAAPVERERPATARQALDAVSPKPGAEATRRDLLARAVQYAPHLNPTTLAVELGKMSTADGPLVRVRTGVYALRAPADASTAEAG